MATEKRSHPEATVERVLQTKIQNYELTAVLGSGGMGTVYVADHLLMSRKVAIKLLRRELAQDQSVVQRFVNEARAINAIRHPNIVEVFDVGLLPDGLPYLVMELLAGEPLSRRIARAGRLPVGEAIEIVSQAASALAVAHRRGIVHRDLKPDNLFLVRDEERPDRALLKVLDFGIAKLRREISGASVGTSTGVIVGTPRYMSPEQCQGIGSQIDQRSDIYSLGVVLYEMLVGRPPFESDGFGVVLMMHMAQPPTTPRALNPEIPPSVEAAILRALAKRPQDRFATMEELKAALGTNADSAITLPPQLAAEPAGPMQTMVLPKKADVFLPPARPVIGSDQGPPNTTLGSSVGISAVRTREAPLRRRMVMIASAALALGLALAAVALLARPDREPTPSPAPGAAGASSASAPAPRPLPVIQPKREPPAEEVTPAALPLARPADTDEGAVRPRSDETPAVRAAPADRRTSSPGRRHRRTATASPGTTSDAKLSAPRAGDPPARAETAPSPAPPVSPPAAPPASAPQPSKKMSKW